MKQNSPLREKASYLSSEVLELSDFLKKTRQQAAINGQFRRSGTAVGALLSEAEFAQSRADFINKLSVALKEAGETRYWLNLLIERNSISLEAGKLAMSLVNEVIRMLVSSLKTLKGQ